MIQYRPASQADFEFLFYLHRAAMRAYVEETFGDWDDQWQRAYFSKHFNLKAIQIIQLENQDIGAFWIEDRTEELFLANIEILPAFQRRGIGSMVMQNLLETAREKSKPVALQVLKVNRQARDLYQRLGFGITGENDTHYIMAYEKRGP